MRMGYFGEYGLKFWMTLDSHWVTFHVCCYRESQQRVRQERADELDFLIKQLDLLTKEVKEKITVMVAEVEQKVGEVEISLSYAELGGWHSHSIPYAFRTIFREFVCLAGNKTGNSSPLFDWWCQSIYALVVPHSPGYHTMEPCQTLGDTALNTDCHHSVHYKFL